jgi:hypothetical protein
MSSSEGTSSALYDGRAKGLVEFLEYVRAKGILAGQTAEAYKSACTRVLAIDGADWATTDVRILDVERQVERYIRLRGASASPTSLATYRQRVKAAINLYRTFLDNPTAFRGPTPRRPGGTARSRPKERETKVAPAAPTSEPAPRQVGEPDAASSLVTYPFPMRSGAMIYLQLPRNLPRSEVKRLCAFLESLAIDPPDGDAASTLA